MKIKSSIISIILMLTILLTIFIPMFSVSASAAGKWVNSWATSIVNAGVGPGQLNVQDIIPTKSTIRIELKVTVGGEKLKFKFSNEYGDAPIEITDASVGRTVGEGKAVIEKDSAVPITFNEGNNSVSIPAGEVIWSDAIDFETEAFESISVSLYFGSTTYITSAGLSNARTFLGLYNIFKREETQCDAEKIYSAREVNIGSGTITYHTTPFLAEIDTFTSNKNTDVAVFIGDSTLVNNTYLHFAEKLIYAGYDDIAIINKAVIGNKLLSDGTGIIGNLYGKALIDRFERDALSVSGVKYIFVKIGLNDIVHQFSKSMGRDVPKHSAADLIEGYKDLVNRAHSKGIKIYFFSKSPWKGYEREFLGQKGDVVWTPKIQSICDELDKWIKTNTIADGYIDCSPLANPADTYALCPSFTPDGAHLTEIASIALADLIPVSFVGVKEKIKTSAEINNVNPYIEKQQIQYRLDHPDEFTTSAPVTQPSANENPVTDAPTANSQENDVPTTIEPITEMPTTLPSIQAETTLPPVIVAPQTPETTTGTGYYPPVNNEETVPLINYIPQQIQGDGVEPNYSVSEKTVTSIGGAGAVVFVLILFTIVIIIGAMLFLRLNKKNYKEFS